MLVVRCIVGPAMLGALLVACAGDPRAEGTAATHGIHGRVEDAAGAPVAGAQVTLRAVDWTAEHTTTSGPDGAFRFDQPTMWGRHLVIAERGSEMPGGVSAPFRVRAGTGPAHGVTVRLGSGTAVSVRVVGPDGRPLSGATVHVLEAGNYPRRGRTGADGLLVLGTFEAGHSLHFTAWKDGYAGAGAQLRGQAGRIETLALALEPARTLHGRV